MLREFNLYLKGLDLGFWSKLIQEYGSLRIFNKGEEFVGLGNVAKYVGLIKSGSVKYIAYTSDYDEKIVGLETIGGFAASWPYCLHNRPSVVSIIANSDSEIYCLSVNWINEQSKKNIELKRQIEQATNMVFYNTYERLLSFYIETPKERYDAMLKKCPKIFEIFSLKDISSFLNITPTHLSRLRKND